MRLKPLHVFCVAVMLSLSLLPNLIDVSYSDDAAGPQTLAELGVIKNSTVTLGPGQTKNVDLSSKISGRFSATAQSADGAIAGVSDPRADRANHEHISAVITAGENETNEVKTTTVTFTVTREVINVEIPGREPGARVNTPGNADRVQTMTITVNVLPKRRYEALQDAARVAAEQAARERAARAAARPNPNNRRINLCVGEQRLYSMDNEVRNTPERNKPEGNPVQMRGIQVTRNTNPAAVGAQAFAGFGADGRQTADPVKLQLVGSAVGDSTVTVEENPAPLGPPGVAIGPWRQVFDVSVKACPGKTPRVVALPEGYRELVIPVPRVATGLDEDDWLDDGPATSTPDSGEKSVTPGSKDKTANDKSTSEAPKEMKMMMGEGLKTYNAAFSGNNGQSHEMTVNCPQDAAAGDIITCSVFTDSTDSAVQLNIESTQVFFDTPHGPGPQTFTVTLPKDKTETPIVLRGAQGQILVQSVLALMPEQPMPDKAQIYFPRECHATGPMQFKGAFPENVQQTSVEVNGQQAPILAKSPRTLVAQNPTGSTGTQQVVVKEGAVTQRGMIESVPNNVAINTGQPTTAQSTLDGACQEQVSLYKQNLRSEVDRNWHPPKPYTKGTWVTLLQYDLTKDNRVVNINVVKPSGDSRLDQAAVSRVYQLQGQFQPIPKCYDKDRLQIDHTFKIIYR